MIVSFCGTEGQRAWLSKPCSLTFGAAKSPKTSVFDLKKTAEGSPFIRGNVRAGRRGRCGMWHTAGGLRQAGWRTWWRRWGGGGKMPWWQETQSRSWWQETQFWMFCLAAWPWAGGALGVDPAWGVVFKFARGKAWGEVGLGVALQTVFLEHVARGAGVGVAYGTDAVRDDVVWGVGGKHVACRGVVALGTGGLGVAGHAGRGAGLGHHAVSRDPVCCVVMGRHGGLGGLGGQGHGARQLPWAPT